MTPSDSSPRPRLDRRTAIKWMLTAAASIAIMDRATTAGAATATTKAAVGYGTDPELNKNYKPGDFWPLTFTAGQRRTATALCDVIIPADAKSPAASTVGVPDFIDEWISAPYPGHDKDRALILDGLVWIDAESQKRFGNDFADLIASQQRALCDDICYVPKAKPEFKTAALFFNKFRDLTSGGFYTTPEGMKDLGYVGNVPIATYEGPTPAALKHLGLA
jgi:hypothetical protein